MQYLFELIRYFPGSSRGDDDDSKCKYPHDFTLGLLIKSDLILVVYIVVYFIFLIYFLWRELFFLSDCSFLAGS